MRRTLFSTLLITFSSLLFIFSDIYWEDYKINKTIKDIKLAKKAMEIIDMYNKGDIEGLKKIYPYRSISEKRLMEYLVGTGNCSKNLIMDELMETYNIHKKAIENLSIEEKKKYLYDIVLEGGRLKDEWRKYGIMSVEGAILHIIEIPDSYKDMLVFLNKEKYLPSNEKECKNHQKGFTFRQIMDVIKSHPEGKRCLSKVEDLTRSQISCIREEALEVYHWLNSGIVYPYKYSRILFYNAEDLILPGEKDCHL